MFSRARSCVRRLPSRNDPPRSLGLARIAIALLVTGVAAIAQGQSASLVTPTSGSPCIDSVSASYSISEPSGGPQRIWLTWIVVDSNSVYYTTNWILTLASTNTTDSFSFNPTTITSNPVFHSVTPALPMPDTTWNVYVSYQRPASVGGATINSPVKTNVRTDTRTLTGTISSPTNGASFKGSVPIQYAAVESVAANSARLIFTGPVTNVLHMTTLRTNSFLLNPTNILSSSVSITSATVNAMADGVYGVAHTYRDIYGHTAVTSAVKTFTLDNVTLPPSLLEPTASSLQTAFAFRYLIPEEPLSNSVVLSYVGPETGTIPLPNTYGTNADFTLAPPLANGVYSFTLSYQDALSNTAAAVTVSNVNYDCRTDTPMLFAPSNSFSTAGNLPIFYSLPEAPAAGSVRLIFESTQTMATLTMKGSLVHDFVWNVHTDPNLLSSVISATTNALPDGVYSMTLRYQDIYGNPAASAQVTRITVDSATTPPVLTLPGNNSAQHALPLAYSLPESTLPGSVKLSILGPTNVVFTMADEAPAATVYVNLDGNITNMYPFISADRSIGVFPDGAYTVALSYQDYLGNAAVTSRVTNVVIDTVTLAPVLIVPANNFATRRMLPIMYGLYENPLAGSVALIFSNALTSGTLAMDNGAFHTINWDVQTNPALIPGVTASTLSALPDGVYSVILRYQDAVGNAAAIALATNIVIDSATAPPSLLQPVESATYFSQVPIEYEMPDLSGLSAATLTIDGPVHAVFALNLSIAATTTSLRTEGFELPPAFLSVTPTIVNLPDGIYSFTLSCQDGLTNPAATVSIPDVRILTPPASTDVSRLVMGTNLMLACYGKTNWTPTLLFATNLLGANPWTSIPNSARTFSNGTYTLQFELPTSGQFFLRTETAPPP